MYKIDKDIPVPESRFKYPIITMEIGDSFLVPKKEVGKNLCGRMTTVCKKLGIKLQVKKQDNGDYRVWRVE